MMGRYSLAQFVQETTQKDQDQGVFELESKYMLEVNVRGRVWTKTGSMVAYQGGVRFKREGAFEHGFWSWFKRSLTGEGTNLTKAEGVGRVYLADSGKQVTIVGLSGDALCVNGNDLLAFEDGIRWDIRMMRRVSSMMAGGLFNVRLEGKGMVAMTSHGQPLTLRVLPGKPVVTDPNATVAWSGNLEPQLKTDINLRTLIGRGSGEAFQMHFEGDGFVVVQPYEEHGPRVQGRR
jgi:uncharacterized protein (AIM24 family)